MMSSLIFYLAAGVVISAIAEVLGASMAINLCASLIAPPLLLFTYRIYESRHI